MLVHAIVGQNQGMITVTIQCSFNGQPSPQQDAIDSQKIGAFGDPKINIAGSFIDPNNNTFTFQFPETENWQGITTTLSSNTARFYVALPATTAPGQQVPVQGPLDCITPNPSEAATAWVSVITSRITQAMLALRLKMLTPVIPDTIV
jgi:hypothetical protein